MDLSKIGKNFVFLSMTLFCVSSFAIPTIERVERNIHDLIMEQKLEVIDLNDEAKKQDGTYQVVIDRLRSGNSIEKESELDTLDIELMERRKFAY